MPKCVFFFSEQGSLGTSLASQNSAAQARREFELKQGGDLSPGKGVGLCWPKCVFFILSRAPWGRSAPTKTVQY